MYMWVYNKYLDILLETAIFSFMFTYLKRDAEKKLGHGLEKKNLRVDTKHLRTLLEILRW